MRIENILSVGDQFPALELKKVGGGRIVLPEEIDTDYAIVLFYRGSWCPFCIRLLEGYERNREVFAGYGFSLFAASADSTEDAGKVARTLGFPLGHSLSRADADAIGAWWGEDRSNIQPSEFILSGQGRVMASTYSNSPLGRMDPTEALNLMKLIIGE